MKKNTIVIISFSLLGALFLYFHFYGTKEPVETTSSETKTIQQKDWRTVPTKDIVTALKNNAGIEVNESFVSYIQQIDFTGDGVPEGIFGLTTVANGTTTVILGEGMQGNIVPLRQKQVDGSYPVALVQFSGGQYTEDYQLLPEELGYYTSLKSDSSDTRTVLVCNSFTAYRWNKSSNQFEQSDELTQKYQFPVCTIPDSDYVIDLQPSLLKVGKNTITAKVINKFFIEGAVYFEVLDGTTQIMVGIPGYSYNGRMITAINDPYTSQYVNIRHEINIPENLSGKTLTIRFIAADAGISPNTWETQMKVE